MGHSTWKEKRYLQSRRRNKLGHQLKLSVPKAESTGEKRFSNVFYQKGYLQHGRIPMLPLGMKDAALSSRLNSKMLLRVFLP